MKEIRSTEVNVTMTYNYVVLYPSGLLYTRTITNSKAERLAAKINGTVKAQVYIKGGK